MKVIISISFIIFIIFITSLSARADFKLNNEVYEDRDGLIYKRDTTPEGIRKIYNDLEKKFKTVLIEVTSDSGENCFVLIPEYFVNQYNRFRWTGECEINSTDNDMKVAKGYGELFLFGSSYLYRKFRGTMENGKFNGLAFFVREERFKKFGEVKRIVFDRGYPIMIKTETEPNQLAQMQRNRNIEQERIRNTAEHKNLSQKDRLGLIGLAATAATAALVTNELSKDYKSDNSSSSSSTTWKSPNEVLGNKSGSTTCSYSIKRKTDFYKTMAGGDRYRNIYISCANGVSSYVEEMYDYHNGKLSRHSFRANQGDVWQPSKYDNFNQAACEVCTKQR